MWLFPRLYALFDISANKLAYNNSLHLMKSKKKNFPRSVYKLINFKHRTNTYPNYLEFGSCSADFFATTNSYKIKISKIKLLILMIYPSHQVFIFRILLLKQFEKIFCYKKLTYLRSRWYG